VRVANQQLVPVLAIGVATVFVEAHRAIVTGGVRTITKVRAPMRLSNVYVVPGIASRLFSCRWGFERDNIGTLLDADLCLTLPTGESVPFVERGMHYAIDSVPADVLYAGVDTLDGGEADRWHGRLGHLSIGRVHKTLMELGINGYSARHDPKACDACLSTRRRNGHPSRPTTAAAGLYPEFGSRIDTDIMGPLAESDQGFTYAINFVDRSSRLYAVYFMRGREHPNVLDAAKTFMRDHAHLLTKTRVPGVVDLWHCDNAGEFTDMKLEAWAAAQGIQRSFSIAEVHASNGAAERCWGVLTRSMRAMLAHAGGDEQQARFWPYLLLAAVHCHNNVYSFASAVPAIPIVLASGSTIPPFPLRKFKVMLCDCWVSIKTSETYDKLAPRRIKGVHLGYDSRRRGYFVWLPELGRITTASDVEFCEDSFTQLAAARPGVKILRRAHNKELPEVLPITAALDGLATSVEHPSVTVARARIARTVGASAASAAMPLPLTATRRTASTPASRPAPAARPRPAPVPPTPPPSRPPPPPPRIAPPIDAPSGRTRSVAAAAAAPASAAAPAASLVVDAPTYELAYVQNRDDYTYAPAGSLASDSSDAVLLVGSVMGESYEVDLNIGIVPIPRSYAAAVTDHVYGAKWRAACDDDFKGKYTLLKTWELVKSIPVGRRVIKGKWVFTVKYKSDGTVDKFKARYVGCGYNQVQGVDYVDSFCSTLRLESLRIFLAGACIHDDDLLEVDVVKAFPSGDWDGTEMYLQQPPGYVDANFKACRLLRPLEGTKQAGNLWMVGNNKTITGLGFEQCAFEPNVWRKVTTGGLLRLAVYVDNVVIRYPRGRRDLADAEFVIPYGDRYNITIIGEPKILLGIEITRNRAARTLTLAQGLYIEKIFNKFCSARTTKDFSVPVHQAGIDAFHSMQPGNADDRLALGHRNLLELLGSLLWATATHPEIDFYVSWLCQFMSAPKIEHYDAGLAILSYLYHARAIGLNYSASHPELEAFCDASWGRQPRDFFGFALIFGGAAVSACSKRIKIITLATQESELYGYAQAARALRFSQLLIEFLGHQLRLPSPIHTDSASAIPYLTQPGATARTRHYEKFILFGREQCANGVSKPVWLSTTDLSADLFTKALDKTSFLRHRASLLGSSRH
jgi:transposase InsO family protein